MAVRLDFTGTVDILYNLTHRCCEPFDYLEGQRLRTRSQDDESLQWLIVLVVHLRVSREWEYVGHSGVYDCQSLRVETVPRKGACITIAHVEPGGKL